MKTIVIVLAIVGLALLYLNRDRWFSPPQESEFCRDWHAQFDADDFNLDYNERARAVANGCI